MTRYRRQESVSRLDQRFENLRTNFQLYVMRLKKVKMRDRGLDRK